ncbi:hypothetical protein Hanom_Chr14g01303971 [Helianthus anomalus]
MACTLHIRVVLSFHIIILVSKTKRDYKILKHIKSINPSFQSSLLSHLSLSLTPTTTTTSINHPPLAIILFSVISPLFAKSIYAPLEVASSKTY